MLTGQWRDFAFVALIASFACMVVPARNAVGQSLGATVGPVPPQNDLSTSAKPSPMYVGARACADCHSSIFHSQERTAMGQAALKVSDSGILSTSSPLQFRDGPYNLQIQRERDKVIYTASDGKDAVSVSLIWAFGLGNAGQTYIFEKDGVYYETRVSYYNEIHELALTIGHSPIPPTKLSAALGRPLSLNELNQCFSCHTSEDMIQGKLALGKVHPGVTCENCHGSGNDHVRVMESSPVAGGSVLGIFNPGRLPPADANEFCARCHRSTSDVLKSNIRDVRNVRFQPYRLENSRCYDPTDKRITCVACHDPHDEVSTSSEKYDAKCQACHSVTGKIRRASQSAPACPTASANCVSCHMPETVLPGSHFAFTDHYIRVTHAGERYPE